MPSDDRLETIKILSAGAPKTGLADAARRFTNAGGLVCDIEFATAPVLRERVDHGTADADIIVAPTAAMDAFEAAAKIAAESRIRLGDIKTAVVVRDGAREPDISTKDALRQEILNADSLVYNKASSGQYIEEMMAALGVAEDVRGKVVRTDSGAGVMEHLAGSNISQEIGFGQLTEIRVHNGKGTHLVGALPEGVANITTYFAALLTDAASRDVARGLLDYLDSGEAREFFVASGVAQPTFRRLTGAGS